MQTCPQKARERCDYLSPSSCNRRFVVEQANRVAWLWHCCVCRRRCHRKIDVWNKYGRKNEQDEFQLLRNATVSQSRRSAETADPFHHHWQHAAPKRVKPSRQVRLDGECSLSKAPLIDQQQHREGPLVGWGPSRDPEVSTGSKLYSCSWIPWDGHCLPVCVHLHSDRYSSPSSWHIEAQDCW